MSGLYLLVLSLLVQDQLQQKIVCPGVVTCLNASPDGLFLAAAVAEAIYLWEVGQQITVVFSSSSSLVEVDTDGLPWPPAEQEPF